MASDGMGPVGSTPRVWASACAEAKSTATSVRGVEGEREAGTAAESAAVVNSVERMMWGSIVMDGEGGRLWLLLETRKQWGSFIRTTGGCQARKNSPQTAELCGGCWGLSTGEPISNHISRLLPFQDGWWSLLTVTSQIDTTGTDSHAPARDWEPTTHQLP